jgi:hypothetical protein
MLGRTPARDGIFMPWGRELIYVLFLHCYHSNDDLEATLSWISQRFINSMMETLIQHQYHLEKQFPTKISWGQPSPLFELFRSTEKKSQLSPSTSLVDKKGIISTMILFYKFMCVHLATETTLKNSAKPRHSVRRKNIIFSPCFSKKHKLKKKKKNFLRA